ncbi:MAG: hypothetical protein KDL87_06295 [Verrucomicrobiae bacterium]|nr:hypothetical protein [Verrucomicrobiae bacterium]
MKLDIRSRSGWSAFSLLEVVLALALFGLAAVGLMGALNQVSRFTVDTVDEAWITERLRSLLTEISKNPRLEPGEIKFDPDRNGIGFLALIERYEPKSAKGETLQNLLQIKVTAVRPLGGGRSEVIGEAQTLRYVPLFQQ